MPSMNQPKLYSHSESGRLVDLVDKSGIRSVTLPKAAMIAIRATLSSVCALGL